VYAARTAGICESGLVERRINTYRARYASALAIAALTAILVPSNLHAQAIFQRTYGGTRYDEGRSVQQTADGGYVVAGHTESFGAGLDDVYLIKTDAAGDTQWTRTFGGTTWDCGKSVQQTTDGGYVVAGYTTSFGAGGYDVYLIKTDADGDTLWTRTLGGAREDVGQSVQQTSDSGYIIAATTYSFNAGTCDVWLIKTDADGDTLWTRTYGDTSDMAGYSIRQTADGGFVVTGIRVPTMSRDVDVLLIKTDAHGDTVWTRTFGGVNEDRGNSVQQTTDSGYIVTGYTASFGAGSYDVWLIKADADGDTLWTRTFGGTDWDQGNSVQQTVDGGYIVTGYTASSGAGSYDVYLIKTDAGGDAQWTRTFGDTDWDRGNSVQQTADGGYVVVGFAMSLGGSGHDVYLIRTDSLGNAAVAEPETSPTRAPVFCLICEPNPAAGETTVRLSNEPGRPLSATLSLCDACGRLVMSRTIRALPVALLTADLAAGAYFVRLDTGDRHATARLILQK
jgi:hypothetical protein